MSDQQNTIEDFGDVQKAFEGIVDASKDKFDAINLREEANQNGKVIGKISNGERVTVAEVDMLGWAKVTTDSGKVGYALYDYIKKV